MAEKRKLVINKGEEFKLSIRNKIDRSDIFYNQYLDATRMLDDILAKKDDESARSNDRLNIWRKTEYENNIIAFCGERGEGKSSAMMSFINTIYNSSKNDRDSIFTDYENVNNTYFAEPIVIDPSMLDGIHNVLDIVLAALYRNFKQLYEMDNQSFYVYKREELLNQFQEVYKRISLINNHEKLLDDEYDYEGNISKLSKLGQSIELRDELEKLIKMYLEIMVKEQRNDKRKCEASLLVAIDDLDLCSSHAYKMSEQIRKYLILPNVVIVMAVKIEQLELCVKEKNIKNFKNILYKRQEDEIFDEINDMSERYVAKLIPKVRRNYLPNVRMMHNVEIIYRDLNGENILSGYRGDSTNDIILQLVYQKTGMRFLVDSSGKNYFLPDNLRDTVNIVSLLANMEDPKGEDSTYFDNIQKFSDFYERVWLHSYLNLESCQEVQKLLYTQLQVHESVTYLLNECYTLAKKKNALSPLQCLAETNDSFLFVMNWLEIFQINVFGDKDKRYAYMLHILYTIRLNKMLRLGECEELINFLGGYMWGWNFQNVLPYVQGTMVDRSRFVLPTVHAFNTIASEVYPNKKVTLSENSDGQYYVSEILDEDENRESKIVSWILLGILSNTYSQNPSYQIIYTYEFTQIIFANHSVLNNIQISIENYIISLCNIESIFKKVNMDYLGINSEEFKKFTIKIQEFNKKAIEAFKVIITNIDVAMEFKEFCKKRRGIKESGNKNEKERTQETVDRFFKNAEDFFIQYLGIQVEKLNYLKLEYDDEVREINISYLYGSLVQASTEWNAGYLADSVDIERKKEDMVKEFASKLRDRKGDGSGKEKVSTYLITKTAQNAKKNMDNLAYNIQQYYSVHTDEKLEEVEISNLCEFYGKIIDIYIINQAEEISEDLINEYKLIHKKYRKTCQ